MTAPDIVSICIYKKKCYFKKLQRNSTTKKGTSWKNALTLCLFEDKCNQKRIMDHVGASRKYGVPK